MAGPGTFPDLRGTSRTAFQIGLKGPLVKNNGGVIQLRNAADNAFIDLQVDELVAQLLSLQGNSLVINSDAAEAGDDWKLTLSRAATGMAQNFELVFPSEAPADNQVLAVQDITGDVITLYWMTVSGGTDKLVCDVTALAFGDATPKAMFNLPAGATITKVKVIVDTAFNGTNPQLSVGITGTTAKYLGTNQVDLTTVGIYEVDPAQTPAGGVEALIATYAADTSSAGAARIFVEYVPTAA